MKIPTLNRYILAFGIICSSLGSSSSFAQQAPQENATRVYVNIHAGNKGAVVSAVAAAGGQVHYEFDSLGAIAATIPNQAMNGLSQHAGVRGIEADPPRYLTVNTETVPYGIVDVEADLAWTAHTASGDSHPAGDGAGVMVGIIDSGLFTTHEDFTGLTLSGYPFETTVRIKGGGKPRIVKTDLTIDDEAFWGRDYDGHGTHVTGTITAVGGNLKGVVGVSPGYVDIYMVKVFGDSGDWIYSSTLVDAAQRAQDAGAQIINMSLGGPLPSSTEQAGMDQLESQGILLVAAAGNDGSSAFHYPASYNSVVSVGAVDINTEVADFSQKNSQVELTAPGVGVESTVPYVDATVQLGEDTIDANPIEFSASVSGVSGPLVDGGLALESDDAWDGKVVLVARGDISFADKVANVATGGGIAAIIYNNEYGNFLGTLGAEISPNIPAVSISQDHGLILLGSLNQPVTVNNEYIAQTSGYEAWDGTSMATPHVSGVAALLWSAYPEASNQDIRDAMTSSALELGSAGRDDSYGFGLVQAHEALFALPGVIAGSGGGSGGGGGETATFKIENLTVAGPSRNGSFEITWDTAGVPSTTDVFFENHGWFKKSELVTSHKSKFRGSKGATYRFYVSSTDANDNTAISDWVTHQN